MRERAKQWGMNVAVAYHGREALTKLRQCDAQGSPIELVSLDWDMPGTSGLDGARMMQADEALRATPRALLTAVQSQPPKEEWIAVGLRRILAKPASAAELRPECAFGCRPTASSDCIVRLRAGRGCSKAAFECRLGLSAEPSCPEGSRKERNMASMHDFEMNSITGENVSLSDYKGKVCLIVNLASA